jgi:hypothetical protein
MTVRRMRIACWIPKAIHTLRICNTYIFMLRVSAVGGHLRMPVSDLNVIAERSY